MIETIIIITLEEVEIKRKKSILETQINCSNIDELADK